MYGRAAFAPAVASIAQKSGRGPAIVKREMVADFHLHTDASDGEMEPVAVVERAAAYGVTRLSTRGSDVHRREDFDRVYGPVPRVGEEEG